MVVVVWLVVVGFGNVQCAKPKRVPTGDANRHRARGGLLSPPLPHLLGPDERFGPLREGRVRWWRLLVGWWRFLLVRKAMTNLDSIFKSKDITLPRKTHFVKAMVFPVVMYRCGSWTTKKAEH